MKSRSFLFALLCAAVSTGTARAALVISHDTTANVTCSGGVCQPSAPNAVLNTRDLTRMLKTGDLKVVTGSGDHTTPTIEITGSFGWPGTNRLTLEAKKNILVEARVSVAGKGALTLTYNTGKVGGELLITGRGKIDFWDVASSLKINGKTYVLASDVKTLGTHMESDRSGAFALANDYDAAQDGTYQTAVVQDGFGGTLEGLGHQIANFTLENCQQGSGFIDEVTSAGALIENIRFVDASIVSCKANSLGVVAGFSYGTIRNVAVSGKITISEDSRDFNSFDVGGVVGDSVGMVEASSANMTIGCAKLGCNIDHQDYGAIGGLVGRTSKGGMIVRSRSSGSIKGWNNFIYAGGLVGLADELVSQSFSTVKVSITGGALYGAAGGLAASAKRVEDCYALGAVSSKKISTVGGLIGEVRQDGSATRAYSTGAITATTESYAGGFVGRDKTSGDLSSTYWDLDTSGIIDPDQGAGNIANDVGIAGLTDAQLKSGLPAGFDPKVWGQSPNMNDGYPYLLANSPQ